MNTSHDIYRCYVLDEILKFARFPRIKTKRQVNAFSIMSSPPSIPVGASDTAKLAKQNEITRVISEMSQNKQTESVRNKDYAAEFRLVFRV